MQETGQEGSRDESAKIPVADGGYCIGYYLLLYTDDASIDVHFAYAEKFTYVPDSCRRCRLRSASYVHDYGS